MTAKEFLIENKLRGFAHNSHIPDFMIDFAKYHVALALKSASENAVVHLYYEDEDRYNKYGDIACEVSKESILTSYPLENIK